jgi:hypothetical protein
MEERLFPLARAIDYVQTGNKAIIEKLSPDQKSPPPFRISFSFPIFSFPIIG